MELAPPNDPRSPGRLIPNLAALTGWLLRVSRRRLDGMDKGHHVNDKLQNVKWRFTVSGPTACCADPLSRALWQAGRRPPCSALGEDRRVRAAEFSMYTVVTLTQACHGWERNMNFG